jgi:hypothetical protein
MMIQEVTGAEVVTSSPGGSNAFRKEHTKLEVYVAFSPRLEQIWLESRSQESVLSYMEQKRVNAVSPRTQRPHPGRRPRSRGPFICRADVAAAKCFNQEGSFKQSLAGNAEMKKELIDERDRRRNVCGFI